MKAVMATDQSVTIWIRELEQRPDGAAAQQLWNVYFDRLTALIRARLTPRFRRVADEEDVALNALKSVLVGIAQCRFTDLKDRTDLWKLLVTIADRKAIDHVKEQRSQKRGGNRQASPAEALGSLAGTVPTPEFAAIVAEEFQRLLGLLDNDELRHMALLKFEGWSNQEIVNRCGRPLRTVERKLKLIRTIWEANSAGGEES